MLYHNIYASQVLTLCRTSQHSNVLRCPTVHRAPSRGIPQPDYRQIAMKKLLLTSLLALIALPALAAPGGAERQQAFKRVLQQFEPMGVTLRGGTTFNRNDFIRHADALKLAAAQPFALFPAHSIDAKSRAKPEIWSQPAKFAEAKNGFLKAVDALDQAARNGDMAAIRKSYDDVSQRCKSCHDAFRGPKV